MFFNVYISNSILVSSFNDDDVVQNHLPVFESNYCFCDKVYSYIINSWSKSKTNALLLRYGSVKFRYQ